MADVFLWLDCAGVVRHGGGGTDSDGREGARRPHPRSGQAVDGQADSRPRPASAQGAVEARRPARHAGHQVPRSLDPIGQGHPLRHVAQMKKKRTHFPHQRPEPKRVLQFLSLAFLLSFWFRSVRI